MYFVMKNQPNVCTYMKIQERGKSNKIGSDTEDWGEDTFTSLAQEGRLQQVARQNRGAGLANRRAREKSRH